jgi:glycosyltransferase involved in cell wall biosynthesis
MKILQFMASDEWGGAEQVFVELSNVLSESHQVTALVMRNCKFKDRFRQSVQVETLKSFGARHNPLLHIEIERFIERIQPDVIHTHAAKATEIIFRISKFSRLNHVATKHNPRPGPIFNKIRKVTAVSKLVASSVKRRDNQDIRVIYNGINPINIEPVDKEGKFTIIAAGRLEPLKGFDILIKAVHKLPFDYRLKIFGEGFEKNNLKALIYALGLDKRVLLEGFTDNIPWFMKKSHLVVICSHSEGFSRMIAEGLLFADVVLSTSVGMAAEILNEEFLVTHETLAGKINDVFLNFEKYKNDFNILSRKISPRFNMSDIADEHVDFYKE